MPITLWLCSLRMTIEIRHLRCFLAIAAEGNVTRAAAQLHLTQPAMSRSLAQLERTLGVALVSRSTHHLELTEAGVRFVPEATAAVRAFDLAVSLPWLSTTPMRVGYTWSGGAVASALVRRWNISYPDRPIVVARSEERLAGLDIGEVDAAITRGPVADLGLRCCVLVEERRVAVLPVDHRLAAEAAVSLADLASERLVVSSRAGMTTPDLWPQGRRPTVVADRPTTDDWLVSIASGFGIGVSVESTATLHPHPQVRFVPLLDAPPVPLLLVWPDRGGHRFLGDLVGLADVFRRADRVTPDAGGA